jgi:uncharacterized membrane protein
MGTIGGKIDLPADFNQVWKYITDPAHFPDWIDGYIEGKLLTPHPTGLGAQYEWYGNLLGFRLRSNETIIEWQEGKKVSYQGRIAGIAFRSHMKVDAAEKDKTILEIGISYRLPLRYGGMLIDAILFEKAFQKHASQSLKHLERILR